MKNSLLLLLFVLLISSCNIFKWTWDESSEDSVDYLDNMFVEKIQSKEYDSALYFANKIIQTDSSLYIGHFYRAKAIRYIYIDNKYIVLQELLKSTNSSTSNIDSLSYESITLPFDGINISRLDSIYRGVIEINKSLENIIERKLCDDFTKNELFKLDYFITSAIYGILSLKDINGNKTLLDDKDLMNILKITRKGNNFEIEGLDSLYKQLSNNPQLINNLIDNSSSLIATTSEIFSSIVDSSVVDNKDITFFIENMGDEILKFKVGDEIDNDGDSQDFTDTNKNGKPDPNEPGVNSEGFVYKDGFDNNGDGNIDEGIDEESINGIDDDNDGLIDEDGNNIPSASGI